MQPNGRWEAVEGQRALLTNTCRNTDKAAQHRRARGSQMHKNELEPRRQLSDRVKRSKTVACHAEVFGHEPDSQTSCDIGWHKVEAIDVVCDGRTEARCPAQPQHSVVSDRADTAFWKYEWVSGHSLKCDRRTRTQMVLAGQNQPERFPPKTARHNTIVSQLAAPKDYMDFAADQGVERVISISSHQGDVDAWILSLKVPQHCWEHAVQNTLAEPNAQAASLATVCPPRCCYRLFGIGKCVLGTVQKYSPGLGQFHPPVRALQQWEADLTLQLDDGLTQGGLRDVQPNGRPAEMQLLCDRNEVSEQAKLNLVHL